MDRRSGECERSGRQEQSSAARKALEKGVGGCRLQKQVLDNL